MLCPCAAQWSDSVTHIWTFFVIFFSFLAYYKVLNIVPSAIQEDLVYPSYIYIYVIYITIYHNLPVLIYFAGMLLTALDTSCGWNHPVFVFLWLALFAQHSVLEVHLCCSMWQDLLFRGFMVFHSWDDPLFLYPFIWLLPAYSWAHFRQPLSARSLCEDSCLLGLCSPL